jgi:diamine N-acetyltransferase
MLKGENVYLRALEPQDLDFLYEIENDGSIWEISQTLTPYSKYVLKEYLKNAHLDIYSTKQFRFVICNHQNRIGLIDIFDFDPFHKRAGIGIVIKNEADKNNGFGSEALQLLIDYVFKTLYLHQVYANISNNNTASIKLFEKFKFTLMGVKKDWNFSNNKYSDELFYQLINPNEATESKV